MPTSIWLLSHRWRSQLRWIQELCQRSRIRSEMPDRFGIQQEHLPMRLARSCARLWCRGFLRLSLSCWGSIRRFGNHRNEILPVRWLPTLFLVREWAATFECVRNRFGIQGRFECMHGRRKCDRLRTSCCYRRTRTWTHLLENTESRLSWLLTTWHLFVRFFLSNLQSHWKRLESSLWWTNKDDFVWKKHLIINLVFALNAFICWMYIQIQMKILNWFFSSNPAEWPPFRTHSFAPLKWMRRSARLKNRKREKNVNLFIACYVRKIWDAITW